jgi:hypothetical protein
MSAPQRLSTHRCSSSTARWMERAILELCERHGWMAAQRESYVAPLAACVAPKYTLKNPIRQLLAKTGGLIVQRLQVNATT